MAYSNGIVDSRWTYGRKDSQKTLRWSLFTLSQCNDIQKGEKKRKDKKWKVFCFDLMRETNPRLRNTEEFTGCDQTTRAYFTTGTYRENLFNFKIIFYSKKC